MTINALVPLGRQGQVTLSSNSLFYAAGLQNEIALYNNKNELIKRITLQGATPFGNYQLVALSNDAQKLYFITWNGFLVSSGAGGLFEISAVSGETRRLDVDELGQAFTYQGWSLKAGDIDLSGDEKNVIFAIRDTIDSKTWVNQETKIYRKNLVSGKLLRVDGTDRGGFSSSPKSSMDGNRILFSSNINLVPENRNGETLYLANVNNTSFEIINKTQDGRIFNSEYGWGADISDNGEFVVFQTGASLTPDDNNGISDVYIKELNSLIIKRISQEFTGGIYPRISPDGRYISYQVYRDSIPYLKIYDRNSLATIDIPGLPSKNNATFNSENFEGIGNSGSIF